MRFSVLGLQTAYRRAKTSDELQRTITWMAGDIARAVTAYEGFGPEVRLVVAPEFALQGIPYGDQSKVLEADLWLDSSRVGWFEPLTAIAQESNVNIIAGTVYRRAFDGDGRPKLYNSAVVVASDGEVQFIDKWIPWSPYEFTEAAAAVDPDGDPRLCVDLDIGRVGVLVCYDMFFPRLWEAVVADGAELLAVPTALMRPVAGGRDSRWRAIIRAFCDLYRIPGVFVNLGSARVDMPPYSWPGGSVILGPRGEELASSAEAGPAEVFASLDLAAIRADLESDMAFGLLRHLTMATAAESALSVVRSIPQLAPGLFGGSDVDRKRAHRTLAEATPIRSSGREKRPDDP